MDKKTQLLMQLIKNGDLGGGASSGTLATAGTFILNLWNSYVDDLKFKQLNYEWPEETREAYDSFLASLAGKQVYVSLNLNDGNRLLLLAKCDDNYNNQLLLSTSLGTLGIAVDNTDGLKFSVNWSGFISPLISANPTLIGSEEILTGLNISGTNYEISDKATRINYLTTAPTEANYDGLIFVVLDSEPAQRYNGYIYIITSEQEI